MMKVVCAPDSFKGSLSASSAAGAMAEGVAAIDAGIEVDRCPISDGGDGFTETLSTAGGGRWHEVEVTGPVGNPVTAAWALLADKTAVMEMAAASGLDLVPRSQRDPTRSTTFGVGQMMLAGLEAGCRRLVLGIGGSATNDGGAGLAQALGVRFYDASDQLITEPIRGGLLSQIRRFDTTNLHPAFGGDQGLGLTAACDVTNPLTGPNGAAAIYGPQKGASPEQVGELDAGLKHLAGLMPEHRGREVETLAGAGAAGGLGAGLVGFLGARLEPGIDTVLNAVHFDQRIAGASLCLTGEGRLDGQTLSGKTILGLARAAANHHVPTVALVGSIGDGAQRTLNAGLHSYHLIGEGLGEQESMRRCAELLRIAAGDVIRHRS